MTSSSDNFWVNTWRNYLDGYPPDYTTEPLEHALADLTKRALSGSPSIQEASREVATLIAKKLKELGEAKCPTSQSVPSTVR